MPLITRGADLAAYIHLLDCVVQALARDTARIYGLTGLNISEDVILEAYFSAAKGPTVFETLLMNQGRMTEDEARVNHLAEMLYAKVEEMVEAQKKSIKYFEVAFSNGNADDCDAEWICIRGTEQPTIAEAQQFMSRDSELIGAPVVGVYPIDERSARSCYDFDNEINWPIFSRGGICGGKKKKG